MIHRHASLQGSSRFLWIRAISRPAYPELVNTLSFPRLSPPSRARPCTFPEIERLRKWSPRIMPLMLLFTRLSLAYNRLIPRRMLRKKPEWSRLRLPMGNKCHGMSQIIRAQRLEYPWNASEYLCLGMYSFKSCPCGHPLLGLVFLWHRRRSRSLNHPSEPPCCIDLSSQLIKGKDCPHTDETFTHGTGRAQSHIKDKCGGARSLHDIEDQVS